MEVGAADGRVARDGMVCANRGFRFGPRWLIPIAI